MQYPPPPWRLRGRALFLPQLLDIARARALVPSDLTILPLLPGRTLGGIYLAAYGTGSVLEYHELIVVAALVHHRRRPGAWISHIYVDDPRSLAGGRAIWGLPKELAEFTWQEASGRAVVRQGDRLLCTLEHGRRLPLGRLPLLLPALSRKEQPVWFRGTGTARVGITRIELEVPSSSPFRALGLGPGIGVHLDRLKIAVHAPVTPGGR